MKTRGRHEMTYIGEVRAFILSVGAKGATPAEIREALPWLSLQRCKHSLERDCEKGRAYRIGKYRELLVFAASVPLGKAEKRHVEFLAALKDRRASQEKAWQAVRTQKAREARIDIDAARVRRACEKFEERAAAKLALELARSEKAASRLAAVVKKTKKITCAVNVLADKFRGTASKKTPAKPAVTVTISGMDTAPRVVYKAPQSRYAPDPEFVGSLSNLPLGVYAEPAGFVARAFSAAR